MKIFLTQINHAVYFSNVQSINYSFILHLKLLCFNLIFTFGNWTTSQGGKSGRWFIVVVLVWATPQVGMYHCTVDVATVTAPICFELHILKPQQP